MVGLLYSLKNLKRKFMKNSLQFLILTAKCCSCNFVLQTLFISVLFVANGAAQPENVNVSGKVTDQDGNTLPGANVVIKGTGQGTVTDLDGNYRLTVAEALPWFSHL